MWFLNVFNSSLELGFIYIILALGVYIAFRVLDIADLGAEGVFPLGGATCLLFAAMGIPCEIALLLSFIVGGIMGCITGLLHTKLKIPSLLAGIITMVCCTPLVQLVNAWAGKFVNGVYASPFLGQMVWPSNTRTVYTLFQQTCGMGEWGIILTLLLFVVILCFVLYWFFGTKLGITIRATGKNKLMARAQSINTDNSIILGLALSNAIIALAGGLFVQFTKLSDSTSGIGVIVIALGSILLGEAIIGKRSFKLALVSVCLGGFIYQFILQLIISSLPNPGYTKLFQAALFVIILCIPLIQTRVSTYKKKKKSLEELRDAIN